MENQSKSIPEKMDIELKDLKRRYDAGKENPRLYEFKVKNLNLIKETAKIGNQEWPVKKDNQEL